MKLNQTAVTVLGVAAIAGLVYWVVTRAAGKVAGAALAAGDSVQDAIIPGAGTLGTWFSDLINGTPTFTPGSAKPPPTRTSPPTRRPDPYDYGTGTPYPGNTPVAITPDPWSLTAISGFPSP